MTASLGDTCISRFVPLLLGSEWPTAKGSVEVHQVSCFTSFRGLLFFERFLRFMTYSLEAAFRNICVHHCGVRRAAESCVPGCPSL